MKAKHTAKVNKNAHFEYKMLKKQQAEARKEGVSDLSPDGKALVYAPADTMERLAGTGGEAASIDKMSAAVAAKAKEERARRKVEEKEALRNKKMLEKRKLRARKRALMRTGDWTEADEEDSDEEGDSDNSDLTDDEDGLTLKQRMALEIRGDVRSYMQVGQMLAAPLAKRAEKIEENGVSESCSLC